MREIGTTLDVPAGEAPGTRRQRAQPATRSAPHPRQPQQQRPAPLATAQVGGAIPTVRPLQTVHGGYTLRSAYQPIFSFSHRRLVGHEALLRATDARGTAVVPSEVFAACTSAEQLRELDRACCRLHAHGFAQEIDSAQWLFLNVDASAFNPDADRSNRAMPLRDMALGAGLQPQQIVIELLEAALPDGPEFARWADDLKGLGFLLALDDFGAGQSNFDRVFRLQPQIVKLDRNVIAQASRSRTVRRAMSQMTSLLHECGALVLIEGVESAYEANIALDCNADFVQGFHFGRPQPGLRKPAEGCQAIIDAWVDCDDRSLAESQAYQSRIRPYAQAMVHAVSMLQAGQPLELACSAFLALKDADLSYLLDSAGMQIGCILKEPRVRLDVPDQFAPLSEVLGARWSRRPYFRRAVAAPNVLQTTRPYPTMHSRRMSVTLSVCCTVGADTVVLCGDMLWDSGEERPAFGVTTHDANI